MFAPIQIGDFLAGDGVVWRSLWFLPSTVKRQANLGSRRWFTLLVARKARALPIIAPWLHRSFLSEVTCPFDISGLRYLPLETVGNPRSLLSWILLTNPPATFLRGDDKDSENGSVRGDNDDRVGLVYPKSLKHRSLKYRINYKNVNYFYI